MSDLTPYTTAVSRAVKLKNPAAEREARRALAAAKLEKIIREVLANAQVKHLSGLLRGGS